VRGAYVASTNDFGNDARDRFGGIDRDTVFRNVFDAIDNEFLFRLFSAPLIFRPLVKRRSDVSRST